MIHTACFKIKQLVCHWKWKESGRHRHLVKYMLCTCKKKKVENNKCLDEVSTELI